jgi:hypothetical protein
MEQQLLLLKQDRDACPKCNRKTSCEECEIEREYEEALSRRLCDPRDCAAPREFNRRGACQ